jgi:mannose-6-phosphate isomerase-like protein (cupin superfamily)
MAEYTLKNLKEDVEDSAVEYGLSPALETRFAREPLETERTAVSYLRVAPGERVPWGHTHKQQEEVYVVVNGSGRVKLDEDLVDLKQWDAVRIPPETMRNVGGGPEGSS